MKLYDLATVIRSKNAGPFTLTIDLMFDSRDLYVTVVSSPAFTTGNIAALYGVREADVSIHPFERIMTVKVTLPRPGASSGAPGDRDVYGCQQHFPLAGIEI